MPPTPIPIDRTLVRNIRLAHLGGLALCVVLGVAIGDQTSGMWESGWLFTFAPIPVYLAVSLWALWASKRRGDPAAYAAHLRGFSQFFLTLLALGGSCAGIIALSNVG